MRAVAESKFASRVDKSFSTYKRSLHDVLPNANSPCNAGNAFKGDKSGITKNSLYSRSSEAMEENGATSTRARGYIPDGKPPLGSRCKRSSRGR